MTSFELSKKARHITEGMGCEFGFYKTAVGVECRPQEYSITKMFVCDSPTTDEWLEILPEETVLIKESKYLAEYIGNYGDADPFENQFEADTPADALCKLALWLDENGLLS